MLLIHTLSGVGLLLESDYLSQVFLSGGLGAEHTHHRPRFTPLQVQRIGRDRADEGELIVPFEALPLASSVGLIGIREEVEGFIVGIEAQRHHLITLEMVVALHGINLMISQWCIGSHQSFPLASKGDRHRIASIELLTVGVIFQHPAGSGGGECLLNFSG